MWNAFAPCQLFLSHVGFPEQNFWTSHIQCLFSRTQAAEFLATQPYDLLAAPRLEKSPSPASSIPPSYMSPGWKERDPNSSPMHNTIVGEVISRYLFLPQPDHRPLISTTQMLSPEPLLTDNWIVKGNWWRSGGIISVPSSTPLGIKTFSAALTQGF